MVYVHTNELGVITKASTTYLTNHNRIIYRIGIIDNISKRKLHTEFVRSKAALQAI
jgi:hypothetical protein